MTVLVLVLAALGYCALIGYAIHITKPPQSAQERVSRDFKGGSGASHADDEKLRQNGGGDEWRA